MVPGPAPRRRARAAPGRAGTGRPGRGRRRPAPPLGRVPAGQLVQHVQGQLPLRAMPTAAGRWALRRRSAVPAHSGAKTAASRSGSWPARRRRDGYADLAVATLPAPRGPAGRPTKWRPNLGRRCHRSPTRPGDRGGCALGQSAAHGSGPRGLVDQLLQRLLQRVGVGFGGRRGPAGRRWVGSTCACRPAAGPAGSCGPAALVFAGMDSKRSSANPPRRVGMRRSWVAVTVCHQGWWPAPFRLGMYLRGTPTAHPRKT